MLARLPPLACLVAMPLACSPAADAPGRVSDKIASDAPRSVRLEPPAHASDATTARLACAGRVCAPGQSCVTDKWGAGPLTIRTSCR